jgi:hypothetical protein
LLIFTVVGTSNLAANIQQRNRDSERRWWNTGYFAVGIYGLICCITVIILRITCTLAAGSENMVLKRVFLPDKNFKKYKRG